MHSITNQTNTALSTSGAAHFLLYHRIKILFALFSSLLLFSTTVGAQMTVTWQVQSDYFAERNAVAQTRTIRSMAVSKDGSAVYTGNIQSPNVGSNAIRKVSSAILATPGTDHVIFGNGMPGGSGAFGPVGGQPVYAGGSTGTFLGWTATGNSPRGLATDDRGYVYAALSSGISPANQVVILSSDLTSTLGSISITGPTGVAVYKSGSTYYLYVAAGTQLRRYNVTNAASPALDMSWTAGISSGADGLTVDTDGVVFLAGGGQVRRLNAAGAITHTVTLANAADIAVFRDKIYVIRQGSPAQSIVVYNKADLSSAGSDLVVPELGAFTRGSLSQFTAIDVTADGRLWVSEENYTGGSNGLPSYTPPVTTFNTMPGAITGRIYFDRVLVSSPVADPCDVAIDDVDVTPEGCPGANDGAITISASTSAGPITYSISGPVNATNSTGVFINLPDGVYTITVSDDGVPSCQAATTANIAAGTDGIPPVINCNNITISLDGVPSVNTSSLNLATANDNCGLDDITYLPTTISCGQVGSTVPVQVTATDEAGNTASCTSQVTVNGLPCGFEQDEDGINCNNGSNFSYNASTGIFTASSTNCFYGPPFTTDGAAFASTELCGNSSITAQVVSITGNGWAGIVMRESDAPGAKKVHLSTNLSTLSRREVRYTTGGQAYPQQFPSQNRYWLRLERQGNQFIGYVSLNGVQWQQVLAVTVAMNTCIEAGLILTNYSANSTVVATFANVAVDDTPTPSRPGQTQADIATPNSQWNAFPSPSSGPIYLQAPATLEGIAQISLVDITGAVCKQWKDIAIEEMPTRSFDLNGLPAGIYLLRIEAAGQPTTTQRIVLMQQ